MSSLFNKTKELVLKIDNFIDLIAQSGLHFQDGLKYYLQGNMDSFEQKLATIRESENNADIIRKDIESQLYVQTLIPESRGDVLGILESMDNIIDYTKGTILKFSIEQPQIPENVKKGLYELTEPVIKSIESLAFATRAFFYDIYAVKDHLHLVKHYEKEADTLAENIQREIFSMDIDLGLKIHLRSFVLITDTIADKAEEVSDRLSIATIKRIV